MSSSSLLPSNFFNRLDVNRLQVIAPKINLENQKDHECSCD